MECQLGSVICRLDVKKHRTRGRKVGGGGGGAIGLRERDEKREPGKKYHLFFRHKEDKNVSSAQKQNVSIDSGCERSLCTGGEETRGTER